MYLPKPSCQNNVSQLPAHTLLKTRVSLLGSQSASHSSGSGSGSKEREQTSWGARTRRKKVTREDIQRQTQERRGTSSIHPSIRPRRPLYLYLLPLSALPILSHTDKICMYLNDCLPARSVHRRQDRPFSAPSNTFGLRHVGAMIVVSSCSVQPSSTSTSSCLKYHHTLL